MAGARENGPPDDDEDDVDALDGEGGDYITIEISNIQLKKLVSASFFSRPNPYCVFQCSGSGKRQKTPVIR